MRCALWVGLSVAVVACGDGSPTAASEPCEAASLQPYADRVAWVSARTPTAHVPTPSFHTKDEDIPPRAPTGSLAAALSIDSHGLVGYDELFTDGVTPSAVGMAVQQFIKRQRGRAAGPTPKPIVWGIAATSDAPAAYVSLAMMALRVTGIKEVSLMLAQSTSAPLGPHDSRVLATLNSAASASEYHQRLKAEFACPSVADAIERSRGIEGIGPDAAKTAAALLPDAMVACACKPSIPGYRSVIRHLGLGGNDPARVAIEIPMTLDFGGTPIKVEAGTLWGAVTTKFQDTDPVVGWLDVADAPIPEAWASVLVPAAPQGAPPPAPPPAAPR